MNAIVLVVAPTADRPLLAEKTATVYISNVFPEFVDNTTPKLLKPSESARTTPPFWTWFIENPRACAA
jgi:hypothetical protein